MSDMLSAGLPVLKSKAGLPALCLVTGATGYIGGRLVVELLNHGYRVRVLARNASRLKDHPWINKVEVAEGDANDEFALTQAMQGVDAAYYLLHALMSKDDFEAKERALAEHFVKCAKSAGVGSNCLPRWNHCTNRRVITAHAVSCGYR
jgi:nucleoside-diphosphate-sugar epimerase